MHWDSTVCNWPCLTTHYNWLKSYPSINCIPNHGIILPSNSLVLYLLWAWVWWAHKEAPYHVATKVSNASTPSPSPALVLSIRMRSIFPKDVDKDESNFHWETTPWTIALTTQLSGSKGPCKFTTLTRHLSERWIEQHLCNLWGSVWSLPLKSLGANEHMYKGERK